MTLPSFAEFQAQALADGFDDVLQRSWAPGLEVGIHSHPFAVKALMTDGELWLTCQGSTRHLQAGDSFELALGEPHAERYGPQGATFWAARRHGA